MLGLAVATHASLCLITGAARADTITVGLPADPFEDLSFPVTATFSATANPTPEIFLTVKPSGPLGCAANFLADQASATTVIWQKSQTPAGAMSGNYLTREPGSYTACAYLQDTDKSAAPLAASGPVAFTVRQAAATVAVWVPSGVDKERPNTLTITATTELQRTVFVTRRRAGGAACGATYALESPTAEALAGQTVQGAQTLSIGISGPKARGRYLLCAYVQESTSDPAPEAVGSSEYYVGPDPCPGAKRALSRANREVRTAERATTRNRVAARRYANRAKRASGAERRRLQRLAKRSRSRYHSAIRQRAKARTALTRAQARVEADC
jgi:hypothetical protein